MKLSTPLDNAIKAKANIANKALIELIGVINSLQMCEPLAYPNVADFKELDYCIIFDCDSVGLMMVDTKRRGTTAVMLKSLYCTLRDLDTLDYSTYCANKKEMLELDDVMGYLPDDTMKGLIQNAEKAVIEYIWELRKVQRILSDVEIFLTGSK